MAYQIPDESGTTPLALANRARSGLGQWTHTKVCADMSMQKKKKNVGGRGPASFCL